jgi:hypothetical protein
MIDKVRSTAITPFLWEKDRVAAYIEAPAMQQDRLPSAICRHLPQSFDMLGGRRAANTYWGTAAQFASRRTGLSGG